LTSPCGRITGRKPFMAGVSGKLGQHLFLRALKGEFGFAN
jgi:hypothetical protein